MDQMKRPINNHNKLTEEKSDKKQPTYWITVRERNSEFITFHSAIRQ
jgi:hypothetical protein